MNASRMKDIHMSERHDRALRFAQNRIRNSELRQYMKELYLYGSLARNEGTWRSDIDLFLVLDPSGIGNRQLKREIILVKGTVGEDHLDAPEVDLKVTFGDEWKRCPQMFYKNIQKEAIRLW